MRPPSKDCKPRMKRQPTLAEEQAREAREAFDLFDLEKRGRIGYHELKVALRALGFDVRKADALRLVASHGAQGAVAEDEFLEIVAEYTSKRDPEAELLKAFELFDEDRTGRISLRNMRRICRELGESLADEELQAMIDEFDGDGDGQISFVEFAAIMRSSDIYE